MSSIVTINSHEAQSRMNAYGTQGVPFFFAISYNSEQTLIAPLSDIDESILRFDFRGFVPCTNFSVSPSTPSPSFTWEVQPPSFESYQHSFDIVQRALGCGDSCLVNLTARVPIVTNLSLDDIYEHTQAPFRLWWRDHFVCFSPEPFVEIEGNEIRTFPMKGTIDASLPNAEQLLLNDEKEREEHAAVVELLSDDLRQIATQVYVRRYRYVERINTHLGALLETSSEIVGTLPENYHEQLGTLLFRLLPAGSITGAPKSATVQLIAEAETYDRGFYTGVMGVFDGQRLSSSVIIRFVEQEADGQLVFKAGGGVTARSTAQREYEELITKSYVPIH